MSTSPESFTMLAPYLAHRLRVTRLGVGLPINTVAHAMNIPSDTLCEWERGKSPIPIDGVFALLDFYCVDHYVALWGMTEEEWRALGRPLPTDWPH